MSAAGDQSTSLLSMQLTRQKTKKVVVNYFTEGDSGTKLLYELEVNDANVVAEIIGFSCQHFSEASGVSLRAEDFVLRAAKKDGKPKTEYPLLDPGQAVYSSGFVSFCLCPAGLKTKLTWETVADDQASQGTVESTESREFLAAKPAPKPVSKPSSLPAPKSAPRNDLPPPPAQTNCSCRCF